MSGNELKFVFGWGFALWLIGYILGIVLFPVVPVAYLGWVIMPIGIAITLFVLFRQDRLKSIGSYLKTGVIWTLIAVICDFFFLVKLLKPADGYYKPDVYLYYLLTFLLPIFAYYFKNKKSPKK